MHNLIILVVVVGYIGIALEHVLKINKAALAVITGILCWILLIFSDPTQEILSSTSYASFTNNLKLISPDEATLPLLDLYRNYINVELSDHLGQIAQILFFLLGAMSIVELVDSHNGFRFITTRITNRNIKTLLWVISIVTFFLSSLLDNLTTAIVMVSLVKKLIPDKNMRLYFTGMIVIAANAGGAWTPIGDVTTTMLWIGGQITAVNIMKALILPSLVSLLVPLLIFSLVIKTESLPEIEIPDENNNVKGGLLTLIVGLSALISVPIFKTFTHLPPYAGMLFGLGLLWVISEVIHKELHEVEKRRLTITGALSRIDVSNILFFLGILLAVGALESGEILNQFSTFLNQSIGNNKIIISIIGFVSSIIDNVPLVAASMGMYNLHVYPPDDLIWEYLAYCAGTGGSILIIGSAAGVAVMGMENITFGWYLKKISPFAIAGYVAGALVYLLLK